ncbi:MAG: hypothetical protein ACYCW6_26375 [Candidatus Xenobia bacterium]
MIMLVGGLLFTVGTIWWLAECFMSHKVWGWAAILTFPIANIVWLFFFPKRGWKPATAFLVGGLLAWGGYVCVGPVAAKLIH